MTLLISEPGLSEAEADTYQEALAAEGDAPKGGRSAYDWGRRPAGVETVLHPERSPYEAAAPPQGWCSEAHKMELLGRLSAGIAHEVKNPLAVIVAAAECLSGR